MSAPLGLDVRIGVVAVRLDRVVVVEQRMGAERHGFGISQPASAQTSRLARFGPGQL